jgi:hypothetical protein
MRQENRGREEEGTNKKKNLRAERKQKGTVVIEESTHQSRYARLDSEAKSERTKRKKTKDEGAEARTKHKTSRPYWKE